MTDLERMKELIFQLNKASNAYYNSENPIMSDYEWDNMFDELKKLELKTGILMANSPTQNVGYKVKSELKKVKHNHPMLSLSKTKSLADLKNLLNNKLGVLMLKMDGLTISLRYLNGKLVSAETRGNGEIGEDVLHNALVFENIPLTIPYEKELIVDGEAIITYDDFKTINQELPDNKKYKNPRNLASGSVRQLDSNVAAKRYLKFVAWRCVSDYYIGDNNSFSKKLETLSEYGFTVVPFALITKDADYENIIKQLKQCAKELNYPIDGLVLTYDDIMYGESLGMTGHHPKHSIAFKFYDEEVETILKNIEWTMGKTGTLCPTAIFKPIEIDGTMVERASLHNLTIMNELELSLGDTITVYKANQIIPQVMDNLSRSKTRLVLPSKSCPICGSETKIIKENNTEILVCTNPNCHGKLLGKLTAFASRNKMNIDGLSEETLDKFIKLEWLNSFSDIYRLIDYYDEMIKLSGFGKKSVDKLMESIEKSKCVELNRFIAALSIPGIGDSTAKDVAKDCNYDFKEFRRRIDEMFVSDYDWSYVDGIGIKTNKQINEWIKNTDVYMDVINLFDCITPVISKQLSDINTNNLDSKNFCVTGSVHIFSNRKELQNKIESLGGKVTSSVTSKTNYLINNNTESSSSKNKKAKELGVSIISEEEFIKMIGE